MADKDLMEELCENKATQAGAAALATGAFSSLGLSTGALTALTATKAGVILAALGPWGLAVGGVLLVGGVTNTIVKRVKSNNRK